MPPIFKILFYTYSLLWLTACTSDQGYYDHPSNIPPAPSDSTNIPPAADTSFKSVLSQFRLAHFPFVLETDSEYRDITSPYYSSDHRDYFYFLNAGYRYGRGIHSYTARKWKLDTALHSGNGFVETDTLKMRYEEPHTILHFFIPIVGFRLRQGSLLIGKDDDRTDYSSLWALVYNKDSTLRQVIRLGNYFSREIAHQRTEQNNGVDYRYITEYTSLKVVFHNPQDITVYQVARRETSLGRLDYEREEEQQPSTERWQYHHKILARKQWKVNVDE